jgi:hypothetical protein
MNNIIYDNSPFDKTFGKSLKGDTIDNETL